jgi:hypothetical protein
VTEFNRMEQRGPTQCLDFLGYFRRCSKPDGPQSGFSQDAPTPWQGLTCDVSAREAMVRR